jgi:hypothetical protein
MMMTRTRYRDVLMATAFVSALAMAASPALAGSEACPEPVEDHIPKAPQGTLNLDRAGFAGWISIREFR